MKVFETIDDMREWSRAERATGKRVAFVPTMGALHEGHLTLMREGVRRGAALAVSIFVNPTQFDQAGDFAAYPRKIEGDLDKCRAEGTTAVFVPTDTTIYPNGHSTSVTIGGVTENLCGAARPGHFRGVATVVAKLFNIVQPDIAIFGEKDFQQLVVIRRMVRDLDLPIEIIGCPTVREPDGLAMSSRNKRLTPSERRSALALHRSLAAAEEMVRAGKSDSKSILKKVRQTMEAMGGVRVDYAKIVDADTLKDIAKVKSPALLAIAAFVGDTRLIDNKLFS